MIHVQPHIERLMAYAPPWSGAERDGCLRLDLNESTEPLPQVARDAIAAQLDRVHLYPDYEAFRQKLAEYCGHPPECLLVTNGSDQGIDVIMRAFLGSGDQMVIARPEFPMFGHTASILNAEMAGVPFGERLEFPYEAFRESITAETRLAVVINPNNPTGTPVDLSYIESLLKDLPDTPLLVDEAYFEYTGATAVDLVPRYPNLMVLRTFSKAFAMAGLRLGYVVAREGLIGEFEKVRGPFDVNTLATAAATAQIDHPEGWKTRTAEIMTRSKPRVEEYFESRDVVFYPGAANFLLVELTERDRAVEYLKANRILVRPMKDRLRSMFRMSLGTADEMQRFFETFDRFLGLTDR